MTETTKIRWVIAHEPVKLFLRAAKEFEQKVNALQKEEKIEVEIMSMTEYSQRYNNGVEVTKHDLLDLIKQGKLEMTQIYTSWLAEHFEKNMLIMTLPYLFKDHQHAQRVMEGEVGQHLLNSVTEKSGGLIRGMSFTYCGGYFQLPSNQHVTCLNDLVGRTMRSNRNPVSQATLKALGINPFVCELEDMTENVVAGNCDGGETSYTRMYPLKQNTVATTVVNTEHSLFTTSMIIREDFWASLSPSLQAIIKQASIEAGRDERQAAVDEAVRVRASLIQDGCAVYELTPEERRIAIEKTSVVYEQFRDELDQSLIEKARAAADESDVSRKDFNIVRERALGMPEQSVGEELKDFA